MITRLSRHDRTAITATVRRAVARTRRPPFRRDIRAPTTISETRGSEERRGPGPRDGAGSPGNVPRTFRGLGDILSRTSLELFRRGSVGASAPFLAILGILAPGVARFSVGRVEIVEKRYLPSSTRASVPPRPHQCCRSARNDPSRRGRDTLSGFAHKAVTVL